MGLNDEAEKLRQAKEWLTNCDVTSQHYHAAWAHVCYVYRSTEDCELKSQSYKILTMVMGEDWLN